jgi:hypothetical protein
MINLTETYNQTSDRAKDGSLTADSTGDWTGRVPKLQVSLFTEH